MGFFAFFREEQPPLIDQAFCDVQSMLQNGHEMFAAATAFLLDNEILEVDLKALDNKINHCEQSLRRAVLEHLTIDPNRELIFSLKLISIVHEAERIGDLAKSARENGRPGEEAADGSGGDAAPRDPKPHLSYVRIWPQRICRRRRFGGTAADEGTTNSSKTK